jgi:hypothetical protein
MGIEIIHGTIAFKLGQKVKIMLIKLQLNVKLLLVSIKVLRKIAIEIEITIHPNL